MNWFVKHNWKFTAVGFLLLALCAFVRLKVHEQKDLVREHIEAFQAELKGHEQLLHSELEKLSADLKTYSYDSILVENIDRFKDLEQQGIAIYVYESNTLKLWSTNSFPIPNSDTSDLGFKKFKNGWYEVIRGPSSREDITVIGQLLLKKEYRYSNSYIKNGFNPDFGLDEHWQLSNSTSQDAFIVEPRQGKNMLYLSTTDTLSIPKSTFLLVLEWLGIFLIPLGIFLFTVRKKSVLSFLLTALVLIGTRLMLLEIEAPINLKELKLFQPKLFASSDLVPSLGDLFLHTVFGFTIVLIFFNQNWAQRIVTKSSKLKWFVFTLILGIVYLASWSIAEQIESLVIDSRIALNLSDILSIDAYSIFAFCSLGLILATFFLLIFKLVRLSFDLLGSYKLYAIGLIAFYAISILIGSVLEFNDMEGLLWPLPILLVLGFTVFKKEKKINFTSSIFIVLVFSLFVTYTLEEYVHKKSESEKLKLLNKQAQEKDPITHYLFTEIRESLKADSSIYHAIKINNIQNEDLYKKLKSKYFNRYWEKYNLQVTRGFPGDSILIVSKNKKINTEDFYTDFIDNKTEYIQDGLYFHKKENGQNNYIAIIEYNPDECIYLELNAKFKPEGLGFPVLLVNRQVEKSSLSAKYSFAKYVNDELSLKKGTFPYSHTSKHYNIDTSGTHFSFFTDDHDHLALSTDNKTYIISDPQKGSWGQMASYSYFFSFFSLIGIVMFIITRIIRREKIIEINLKSRFQLAIVSILFFSMLFIGWGSVYYIKQQFNEKNFEAITEKIKSVTIEVEHKLGRKQSIDGVDKEYTEYILNKFSRVFFTDINLYSPTGELIASSQPKVFQEGLVDKRIDANAFYHLHMFEKTLFVQVEDIENMSYLSAYVPFRNKNNELMAYLNLPYFAKSSDLKTEISDFIVALINIYVLLIVVALVFALFVTNRITQPLRLIQARMSQIQLGSSTELIEWHSKDEIGQLITEYNRMVVEIMESANRLAQSEREGAWKEMAQQVAHEIKNPLTPMKLSIQHLQMRWTSLSPEDQQERFKTFASNLIEQIDTLSAIATEFSSFAKMPDAILVETDLVKLIRSSIGVYDGSEGVGVSFTTDEEFAYVLSDKDQMLRVFNNLIKNAIQAIPEERDGKVEVSLVNQGDNYTIQIVDNGKGISESDRHKIFVPNFTTKSSGMGLGLAMVHKIIENSNGSISFESEVGLGTIFTIKIPKIS